MPETEINYKPKIFDDAEKCGNCFYIYNYICNLFPKTGLIEAGNGDLIKHDECKKYYQEAKNGTEQKTITIDKKSFPLNPSKDEAEFNFKFNPEAKNER